MRTRPFSSARTSPAVAAPPTRAVADLTVDVTARLQTMDGFGAADTDSKPFALSSALRTLLWDPVNGIGLSIYRAQVGSDGTPRVDPGDYAAAPWDPWGEMKAARTLNATDLRFVATPWTPPPAMKDSGTESGGHLLAAQRANWAAILASFVTNGAAQTPAIPFFAIAPQNEPDFTAPSSCLYTPAEMTAFLPILRTALDGVSGAPAISMPEPSQWPNLAAYVSDWETNGSPASAVAYYATHQYTDAVQTRTSATPTHYWQTEMSGLAGQIGGTWDPTIANALVVAGWIHDALVNGGVSAWIWWWFMNDWGTGDPPVEADNQSLLVVGNAGVAATTPTITKRLYALGHWSKFVRPGYVRVGTLGAPAGVSVTAFYETSSRTVAIVAINANAFAVPMTIHHLGVTLSSLTPAVTDATRNLVTVAAVPVANGFAHTMLPASSVTTLTGTGT